MLRKYIQTLRQIKILTTCSKGGLQMKNLKDPRIKGKYYHLNEKTQDIQILQKTDLI